MTLFRGVYVYRLHRPQIGTFPNKNKHLPRNIEVTFRLRGTLHFFLHYD
ncbi:hypothetical protein [Vibrio phage vB_VpaS_CHI]|nr:hypothetical protein [Vibrio phage vB_VpaS_ALK]USL90087.1 hypothetical protein [Vibrio phage vB_VpaS_CHI]